MRALLDERKTNLNSYQHKNQLEITKQCTNKEYLQSFRLRVGCNSGESEAAASNWSF